MKMFEMLRGKKETITSEAAFYELLNSNEKLRQQCSNFTEFMMDTVPEDAPIMERRLNEITSQLTLGEGIDVDMINRWIITYFESKKSSYSEAA